MKLIVMVLPRDYQMVSPSMTVNLNSNCEKPETIFFAFKVA